MPGRWYAGISVCRQRRSWRPLVACRGSLAYTPSLQFAIHRKLQELPAIGYPRLRYAEGVAQTVCKRCPRRLRLGVEQGSEGGEVGGGVVISLWGGI